MKKYISRTDAAKKYRIGYQTILTWEKKGLLRAVNAARVRYSQVTNRPGPGVAIVYDESQIEALAQKVVRDAKTIQHSRMEAEAFELLEKGADAIQLVTQLKINRRTAAQIRDFYIEEKDAVVIPNEVVVQIRAMGFTFTRETAASAILGLIEKIRELTARLARFT